MEVVRETAGSYSTTNLGIVKRLWRKCGGSVEGVWSK